MFLHEFFFFKNAHRESVTKRFIKYHKKNVMICFISDYVRVDFLIWLFSKVTKRVE